MRIAGKEINDECTKCGKSLECELFRQGHGIRQERSNIAELFKCQMDHRRRRLPVTSQAGVLLAAKLHLKKNCSGIGCF